MRPYIFVISDKLHNFDEREAKDYNLVSSLTSSRGSKRKLRKKLAMNNVQLRQLRTDLDNYSIPLWKFLVDSADIINSSHGLGRPIHQKTSLNIEESFDQSSNMSDTKFISISLDPNYSEINEAGNFSLK